MDTPENHISFVQSLKGAPASVLLALAFSGRPMSHGDLLLWTRCGHVQISLALRSLTALGWVTAHTRHGPWSLAEGRHVPVKPASQNETDLKALNVVNGLNTENQSFAEETLTTTSAPREQLLETLLELGIEEPTASELASLPHVTPEYVHAHVERARAEGLRLGAAISRMRNAAPTTPRGKSRSEEVEDKIRRFVEGKK